MQDPQKPRRRSIHLREYDYGQPGAYFVTIVTQGRSCLFGQMIDGTMRSNHPGEMARREWMTTPSRFASVQLDAFVVMSNHTHGIVAFRWLWRLARKTGESE